jgi:ABC-type uncharacterized transport system fused permease/ATPase subunit
MKLDSFVSLPGSNTNEKDDCQAGQFERSSECEDGANVFHLGNHRPSFGVSFRSLNVYATASSTDYQKTFGNFLFAAASNAVSYLLGNGRNDKVDILQDCEGLVRSGELVLVLGRPGSGCTTLLRSIAGHTKGLTVNGSSVLNYEGRLSTLNGGQIH